MNTKEKIEYSYKGDVLSFGRVVYRNWKARTYAVSEKKALSNLAFQYKNVNGLAPHAKITLSGKLTAITS